jgi:hypothetical protein
MGNEEGVPEAIDIRVPTIINRISIPVACFNIEINEAFVSGRSYCFKISSRYFSGRPSNFASNSPFSSSGTPLLTVFAALVDPDGISFSITNPSNN